jgi:NarL family two-component system response regulator LiaR
MKTDRIRIIVVDDHSMVRSGLRLFLLAFDDMDMVGEAANGLEALRVVEQTRPDVVLMDLIMPVMDGIRAAREITARYASVTVIGMTSFLEHDLIQEAVHSGMSGLLAKDVSAVELARAIRDVRTGKMAFSPQINEVLQSHMTAASGQPGQGFSLTSREIEVLGLLVSGASNAEISKRLVISLSTAKFHVRSIFEKLRVSNRAEAVATAMQHRLVDGPQPANPESD